MAGASFEIRLEGAEKALAALAEAAGRMAHPAPLFDAIGAMLVTSTQHRFETGIDPQGNSWPPSIRARLEGGRTMVDSARLRNSMTHEANDSGVAVGTNVIYAAIHQLGGVIRPVRAKALHFFIGGREVFAQQVTIPRRAFLGIDDDDETEIAEIAGDFVLAPFGETASQTTGGADAQ